MKIFQIHKFHSYQGYKFPWFMTLLWITFFTCGVIYLVKFILLKGG